MVVDEPCLAIAGRLLGGARAGVEALGGVLHHVREAGARAGIHCCSRPVPGLLTQSEPDFISFDPSTELERFLGDPAIAGFVERGGWLGFGLVPISDSRTIRPTMPSEDAFCAVAVRRNRSIVGSHLSSILRGDGFPAAVTE